MHSSTVRYQWATRNRAYIASYRRGDPDGMKGFWQGHCDGRFPERHISRPTRSGYVKTTNTEKEC
jgi:hypothetical protein